MARYITTVHEGIFTSPVRNRPGQYYVYLGRIGGGNDGAGTIERTGRNAWVVRPSAMRALRTEAPAPFEVTGTLAVAARAAVAGRPPEEG